VLVVVSVYSAFPLLFRILLAPYEKVTISQSPCDDAHVLPSLQIDDGFPIAIGELPRCFRSDDGMLRVSPIE
jgi:hypothetical protein